MCTFEVCLKIPDTHGTSQQQSAQFSFNNLLFKHTMTEDNSNFNKLTIRITGNADSCVMENLFLQTYKILFFNYGYFPEIVSAFKPQLPYYTSAKTSHGGFFREFPPIISELNRILNENSLENMASMHSSSNTKMEPILHGFFSLFSHDYVSVLIEHKMILLLHIFEGYGYFLSSDAKNINYATRHILKECFTSGNGKTRHKILIDDETKNVISRYIEPILQELLGKKRTDENLLNIRNYYSHFYKDGPYQNGKTLFSLFLLISLSIRIRIINDIITPNHFLNIKNENIKECFLIIADYINDIILGTQEYKFQSNYYDLVKTLEMIRKELAS